MTHDDLDSSRVAPELLPLIEQARTSLGHMTSEQCLLGEQVIAGRWSQRSAGAWRWRTNALWVAAILPVLILAAVLLRHAYVPQAISYRIENGFASEERHIRPSGASLPIVRFSDGTELRLSEGTQARIRFVTDRGAALAVDRGRLRAEVVSSSKSEWRFDAGPFAVRVTGTAFELEWQPERDQFDLRLEHGSVSVTAPVANEPIPVRAGQWLTIHPRSNEVLIRDLTTNPPVASVPVPDSPSDQDQTVPASANTEISTSPGASTESHSHPANSVETPRNWVTDLAQGKLDAIVRDAQARGLEDCLAKASSEDLSALADAARYSRQNDIAQKALLAQRRRYPGSRKATEASFLLGKLAEASHNDPAAIGFFDTYLADAPSGTYAAEALGRKMAIVQHASGSASARAIAENYLTKYPQGTYASAARAILHNQ
jgi:TolA-binding protein